MPMDEPFAFSIGRIWVVLCGLIIALILSITRWPTTLDNLKYLLSKNYNKALIAWFLGISASALFSPDPHTAFLGGSWSQMGVWQLGLVMVLFFFAQITVLEPLHWRILAAGTLVLLVFTVLEAIGFRPLFWLPQTTSFPSVTIGQRGHLAGLFAAIAGIAVYRKAFPTMIMCGLGIALCNNTSALLGLSASCFIAIFYYRKLWKKLLIVIALSGISFLSFSIWVPKICNSLSHQVCQGNKEVVTSNESSLKLRLIFWKSAWNMFLHRPIQGWGNEQFEDNWINYLSSYERRLAITRSIGIPEDAEYQDIFPLIVYKKDGKMAFNVISNVHPHNIIFEEFESHGLLGVFLFTLFIFFIIKQNQKMIIVLSSYGVYLTAWFLLFSVLPIYALLFGSLLAIEREERSYE